MITKFIVYILLFILTACTTQTNPDTNSPSNQIQPQDNQLTTDDNNTPQHPILIDVYSHLNQLRNSAGMTSLTKNDALEDAANNHANYLVNNNRFGHDETHALPGFTGVNAPDRANHALYYSRNIGEGIASGKDDIEAIDNLFSAIYHRFSLMNPDFDEIGISGVTKNVSSTVLVHNIANSDLNRHCQESQFVGPGAFYTNVCKNDIKQATTLYDQTLENTNNRSDNIIVWPPVNGENIPPVFFEETPDPLPDYSVSGYPVSVQYNSTNSDEFILNAIYLYEDNTNNLITDTRLLNSSTDPNQKFSENEYALFPLERLKWNTRYRVEMEFSIAGILDSKQWTFETQALEFEIITIDKNQTEFSLASGVETAIYIPPTHPFDTLQRVSISNSQNIQVEFEIFDGNTLLITASSTSDGIVNITLNDGINTSPRTLTAKISI